MHQATARLAGSPNALEQPSDGPRTLARVWHGYGAIDFWGDIGLPDDVVNMRLESTPIFSRCDFRISSAVDCEKDPRLVPVESGISN